MGEGTIWWSTVSRYIASAPRPSASDTEHLLPGMELLHDDKCGPQCSAVQPELVARRALVRQAPRRDMQPAVSLSRLNATCMGMESVRECRQRGPRFPLQIRSRDEYLHGPTEEDQDELASFARHQDSSIASLLLSIGSWGRPFLGGRQWMNASPRSHRPESEFPGRKYPISLLFPTSNRVRHSGCCMAPLLLFSLGRRHRDVPYHPHACCSVPSMPRLFFSRHGLA